MRVHKKPTTQVGRAMEQAIKIVGGATELSNEIGVSAQAVSNWRLRESVPIEFCVPIETATEKRVPARKLLSRKQFDQHVAFVGHFFELTPKRTVAET